MIVKDGISLDMQFIGKKLDVLIQVIEANTAQTKVNAASQPAAADPAVEAQQDAPEAKTDAKKNLETPISSTTNTTNGMPATDDALKKSMIKLYTAHVTMGLNKLKSDIEITTESSRRNDHPGCR